MALTDYLQGIADAIRIKDGTSDVINAQDFAGRILAIRSGDGLPFDVKYGTFTLANDFAAYIASDESVIRPFTLPHGMDGKPDMFIMEMKQCLAVPQSWQRTSKIPMLLLC